MLAGALPQTPLGELTALPQTPYSWFSGGAEEEEEKKRGKGKRRKGEVERRERGREREKEGRRVGDAPSNLRTVPIDALGPYGIQ